MQVTKPGRYRDKRGVIVELQLNDNGHLEEKGTDGMFIYNKEGVRLIWRDRQETYWLDSDLNTDLIEYIETEKRIKFSDRLEVGAKVFIRDGYIEADWMIPQAEIIDVAYEKDSKIGKVYFIEFNNGKRMWFHTIALKLQ